jgi:protoporphyrinogen/coproporphyrinogen III oxidase
MRIAIVGGGVAGLVAAYELELARAAGEPDGAVEYTLFEAGDRLGGVVRSEVVNGVVLERGPDSFLTEKPAAAELSRELGLEGELVPSNDRARKTYIVVKNRLVALPDGLMFLVPTKLIPTLTTRLFSLRTKIRMGLELLHAPRRQGHGDEAVASLVERHYGTEAVERLADPLLSGIFGGDASQLSARAVLPRLVVMENEYGSLTRGMLAAHRKMLARAKALNDAGNENPRPAAARGVFTTLRGGMQQLVSALQAQINAESVRAGTGVSGLEQVDGGWMVRARGVAEFYDAVIVATPAWAAAVLLRGVDEELCEELEQIPYSSSITVNLVYDESRLGRLPDGFGFLVPAIEGRAMLACTFVHRKFLGRTPVGKVVLRAFLGGVKREALLAETDGALVGLVRRELKEILGDRVVGLGIEPEHTQVSRWRRAMAQYAVGHMERVGRIEARVAGLPGLRLVGNAYDGIGISDCIRLGRRAAKELIAVSKSASQPVG